VCENSNESIQLEVDCGPASLGAAISMLRKLLEEEATAAGYSEEWKQDGEVKEDKGSPMGGVDIGIMVVINVATGVLVHCVVVPALEKFKKHYSFKKI